MKKENVLHITETLYIKWSKECWELGKRNVPFKELEKEIKIMFKELTEGEE